MQPVRIKEIEDTELTRAAERSYSTLTVLISGDGRNWRRHGPDLPWEKFQKLVELVGLGLCEIVKVGGQCAFEGLQGW